MVDTLENFADTLEPIQGRVNLGVKGEDLLVTGPKTPGKSSHHTRLSFLVRIDLCSPSPRRPVSVLPYPDWCPRATPCTGRPPHTTLGTHRRSPPGNFLLVFE